MRKCTKCGEWKEESLFKKATRVKSGRQAECYKCGYARRAANYDMYRLLEKKREVRKYGISYEQYLMMLETQGSKCAISTCSTLDGDNKRKLHIDHCHVTGKVRALLCSHCNTVLGKVKESLEHLDALKAYLISHRSKG